MNYHFVARGSGLGDSYNNLDIKWHMKKEFSLALLRDWHQNSVEKIIDFTRYDLKATEPADPSPGHPLKNWCLINVINQKNTRPQDNPRLIKDLDHVDKYMIARHYPEIMV